ncbi:MAG: organic solvent tolerance protein [Cycloclasticus sp. symbiont of Poecilosclerida sp. M]|nr:MAG: organic solvent tolerance protein [Cycloclasticus sp. symbiont of Poecilosclerida sp. M]
MRFYTVDKIDRIKGVTIKLFHPKILCVFLLLAWPLSSFSYDNTKWDCKLESDGETWDCSASQQPIAIAPIPTPVIDDSSERVIVENKPAENIQAQAPRVRLSRQAKQDLKNAPGNASALSNKSNWKCEPGKNNTWGCSQTSTSPQNYARFDEAQSYDHVSARIRHDDLFRQMAKQLAVNPWDTCTVTTKDLRAKRLEIVENRKDAELEIQADYAELADQADATFSGDVLIKRADQSISADHLSYNQKEGSVSVPGDNFYKEKGLALYSGSAELQMRQDTGQFEQTQFIIENAHARGTSQSMQLVDKDIKRAQNITYTTCAPGKTSWEMQADKLELNSKTGKGTARNVWIEIFDVPLLYTPYLSFPLDDRRLSGFLAPTFGASDETGTDISVPYYWNIAENYDATLTPRYLSDRGLMLGGEFRYLTKNSTGQIAAETLDDSQTDDFRGQISIQNKTKFTKRLSVELDLNYISDDDYLEDFGTALNISSSRFVKSEAKIEYQAQKWSLLARADNYDSIDPLISSTSRPHRRIPQILFNAKDIDVLAFAKFDMRNEFVYFDHSSSSITRGKRHDVHPSISVPFRTASGFVTPKIGIRHTSYRLDNQAAEVDANQDRTLPIFSVDAGLFFESNLDFAGGLTQTIEPRAFYLYVPHKNQDNIPLFDTAEHDFSVNQLFRENRFSGADRVGDANQLTLALTTRLLETNTGRERLKASVGAIIYFENPQVTLPTSPENNNGTSDLVAELSGHITNNWQLRSAVQYDTHDARTERATFGAHYKDTSNRLFNVTYRSRFEATDTDIEATDTDIEQTDVSFKWPLTSTWSAVGRWNYSLEDNITLDSFLGLEKDTCCWRFRVIAREFADGTEDEEPNQGIFVQLELKGLTSFGKKVDSFLEDGILGYESPEL